MKRKSTIKAFAGMFMALTCLVGAAYLVVNGQYSGSNPSITGVWQTVVTPKVCNGPSLPVSFPGILLFNQDGTMTGSSTLVSSGYGVWQREPGDGNYSFKLLSFRVDTNHNLLGTRVVWQKVTLNNGSDAMTTDGGFTDYDKTGNQVASGCSTATGTRFE